MISTTEHSLKFTNDFFSLIKKNNINYCILRNADEVKAGDAHDIDLCIEASRINQAEANLYDVAKKHNWVLFLKTGTTNDILNIKCYNFFHIDEESRKISVIHIDFFPTCTWKGLELIPNEALLHKADTSDLYQTAAPEVTAVVNLFTRLFYNGYIKEKYKAQILETFQQKEKAVLELMHHFLDEQLTQSIYSMTCAQQWDAIEAMRSQIIKSAKKTAKKRKLTYWKYLLHKATHPSGIFVVFQGTDGSGKTTIINGLSKVLSNTFSENTLNYYHWRPGFIKAEKKYDANGELLSNVQPHTLPRHGVIISCLKLCFHTLDYLLGYWFKIGRQVAQGHMVVFDRYYYDFFMDKTRYRLKISDFLIKILQIFIPRPDITFLLIGNAEAIHARKNELSVQEIQKQTNTLLLYKESFANPLIVDVNKEPHIVINNVCVAILNKLAEKPTAQK